MELNEDQIYEMLKDLNENEINEVSALLKKIPGAEAALGKLGIKSDPAALAKFASKTIGDLTGWVVGKFKKIGAGIANAVKAMEAGAWIYYGTPIAMSENGKELCDNIQKVGYTKWKEELIKSTNNIANDVDFLYENLEKDPDIKKVIHYLTNEISGNVKSGGQREEGEGEEGEGEEEGEEPIPPAAEPEPEVKKLVRNKLDPGQVLQMVGGKQEGKWAAKPQSGGEVRYFVTKTGAQKHALREDFTKEEILRDEIDRILFELNGNKINEAGDIIRTATQAALARKSEKKGAGAGSGLWCYRRYIKADPERNNELRIRHKKAQKRGKVLPRQFDLGEESSEAEKNVVRRTVLANLERRTAFHKNTGHPWAHLIVTVNKFLFRGGEWYLQEKEGEEPVSVDQNDVIGKTGIGNVWLTKHRKQLEMLLTRASAGLKISADDDYNYPSKIAPETMDEAALVFKRIASTVGSFYTSDDAKKEFINKTKKFAEDFKKSASKELKEKFSEVLTNAKNESEIKRAINDERQRGEDSILKLFKIMTDATVVTEEDDEGEQQVGEPEDVKENLNYKILNNNDIIELQLKDTEYIFEKQDFIKISNTNNKYTNKFLFNFDDDKITHALFENNCLRLTSNDWLYLAKI